jgi:hypothetical protein
MLGIEHLRNLTLRRATHTPGQRHLSAASGLVCANGRVYVVADDEHHLTVFDDAHTHGRTMRLFDGTLPSGMKARKKRKPDSETLALLPGGVLRRSARARGRGAAGGRGSRSMPTAGRGGRRSRLIWRRCTSRCANTSTT